MKEVIELKNKIEKLIQQIWASRYEKPKKIQQYTEQYKNKELSPVIASILELANILYYYNNINSEEELIELEKKFKQFKIPSAVLTLKLFRAFFYLRKYNLIKADDILFSSFILQGIQKKEFSFLVPFYAFLKGLRYYIKGDFIKALKFFNLSLASNQELKIKQETDSLYYCVKDIHTYYSTIVFITKIYLKLKIYYKIPTYFGKLLPFIKNSKNYRFAAYVLLTIMNTPLIVLERKINVLTLLKFILNRTDISGHNSIKKLLNNWIIKVLVALIIEKNVSNPNEIFSFIAPFVKKYGKPIVKALFLYTYYKYNREKCSLSKIKTLLMRLYRETKTEKILSLYIILLATYEKDKKLLTKTFKYYYEVYDSYPVYYYVEPRDFYEYKRFLYQNYYREYYNKIIKEKEKYYEDLFDFKWTRAARDLEYKREQIKDELNMLNKEISSIIPYNRIISGINKINGYNLKYRFFYIKEIGGDFIEVVKKDKEYFVLIGDVAGMGIGAASVIPLIKSRFITSVKAGKRGKDILLEISEGIRALGLERIVSSAILLNIYKNKVNILGAGMFPLMYKNKDAVVELNLNGSLLGTSKTVEDELKAQGRLYSSHSLTLQPKEKLIIITAENPDFLENKDKILKILYKYDSIEEIGEKLEPIIDKYIEEKRREEKKLKLKGTPLDAYNTCDDISYFIFEKL